MGLENSPKIGEAEFSTLQALLLGRVLINLVYVRYSPFATEVMWRCKMTRRASFGNKNLQVPFGLSVARSLRVCGLDGPGGSDVAKRSRGHHVAAVHKPNGEVAVLVHPENVARSISVVITSLHDFPIGRY